MDLIRLVITFCFSLLAWSKLLHLIEMVLSDRIFFTSKFVILGYPCQLLYPHCLCIAVCISMQKAMVIDLMKNLVLM